MAESTKYGDNTSYPHFFCSGLNNTNLTIFLSTLNSIIAITAFLGNLLVIVALPKVSSLHMSSRLLFRCLASTDLCVGLVLQPIYVSYLMSSENSDSCYYTDIVSKAAAVILCGVSLLTLTAISLDRLLALSLGLRFRQVVTVRRVRLCVIVFWLSSSAAAATYIYDEIITVAIICPALLLCVATSTFCYTKIFLTLRHHQTQVQDHAQQGHPNEVGIELNIARYRKTVSSALWVQMTLVACYLPFGIATIVTGIKETYPPSLAIAWELSVCLLTFNSCLNPLLYCWKIRGVRQAVKKTIRKCFCWGSED